MATLVRCTSTENKRQGRIERFSYDLEMKTREQNRNNERTQTKQFDWFIERIQTRVAFGWLSERLGEKTSCPKNFLGNNRYFALTSYCNTIGQSNNAFSIFEFSLAGKPRGHVLIFSSFSSLKFLKPLQSSSPGQGICNYFRLNWLLYFFTAARVKDTCIIYRVQGESRVRKSCKPFSVEPGTHWSILRSKWSAFRDNLQRQMGSV